MCPHCGNKFDDHDIITGDNEFFNTKESVIK